MPQSISAPVLAPGPDGLCFSRRTITEAAHILKSLGHAGFTKLMLEWNFPDHNAGQGSSLDQKANSLAAFALANPERMTNEGQRADVAIVLKAARLLTRDAPLRNGVEMSRATFRALLEKEGFTFKEETSVEDAGLTYTVIRDFPMSVEIGSAVNGGLRGVGARAEVGNLQSSTFTGLQGIEARETVGSFAAEVAPNVRGANAGVAIAPEAASFTLTGHAPTVTILPANLAEEKGEVLRRL